MGPMLLKILSPANAQRYGVKIHGEAVLDGQHTLYIILEAPDAGKVEEFMAPFKQVGEVEVWPANTCETVVSRARC